jgi:hypothetical protein
MPAMVALRCNPILRIFAERLSAAGKHKRLIIGAVMRKLLVLATVFSARVWLSTLITLDAEYGIYPVPQRWGIEVKRFKTPPPPRRLSRNTAAI